MRILTKEQLNKMNDWMQINARPYDRAKWNYLFNGGSKDAIVEEMAYLCKINNQLIYYMKEVNL